jgi:phosphoribosylanthranilate isomerase
VISPRRTRIKFCGMTSAADVALAVAAGADAVGVIVAESARRVVLDDVAEIAAAIPPYVSRIGVLANQGSREASLLRRLGFTLQFSGEESAADCDALAEGNGYIKVFHVDPAANEIDLSPCRAYTGASWMFDTRAPGLAGGSGTTFAWRAIEAASRERSVIVSGGLDASNIAACLDALTPFGVDVRSGIETGGRKDAAKMAAFVAAVSAADAAR